MPVEILEMDIPAVAKLLWADIHSFTGRDAYFFKSNERIADEYQCSQRSEPRNYDAQGRELIEVSTDGRRQCRPG